MLLSKLCTGGHGVHCQAKTHIPPIPLKQPRILGAGILQGAERKGK
jgi:hypothetical protein